jgi:threonine synthase
MRYVSTRGGVAPVAFRHAVMMGLADDGGLLVPESIPDVRARLDAWRPLSYPQLALEVLRLFVDDIPPADLEALIGRSYAPPAFPPEVAPIVRVGPFHVQELWHGPTLAFKDVALQLLGNFFEYILARQGSAGRAAGEGRLTILGATSGDTGSAAIAGVRGRAGIHIFVMHPRGRVSAIQERQMTTVLDDNVHNLAVEGSFDDCQHLLKDVAGDLEFKRTHCLGAVNSVNWARVLAQIVYYFKAAFEVQKATGAEAIQAAVPAGNFGNVLAGWYAMQMGAPISRLILATNENDILARFFATGVYSRGRVYHTLSPSMDIQVASNFERYLYDRVGCNAARVRERMSEFARTGSLRVGPEEGGAVDPAFAAGKATEAEVLATIREYHEKHNYLLDPHTAVGVCVAERQRKTSLLPAEVSPIVCLSTAHPAKFPKAILKATGKDLAHHPAIDALAGLPTRCQVVPNSAQAVRQFIVDTIG